MRARMSLRLLLHIHFCVLIMFSGLVRNTE